MNTTQKQPPKKKKPAAKKKTVKRRKINAKNMATIIVSVIVVLGLIGEYVGRIYMCANAAPQYVAREYIKHE